VTARARYIDAARAHRVAAALQNAGYVHMTPDLCTEYAITVARRADPFDTARAHAIIDSALDGYAVDHEGYGYDAR
jgi:hypothetical protein